MVQLYYGKNAQLRIFLKIPNHLWSHGTFIRCPIHHPCHLPPFIPPHEPQLYDLPQLAILHKGDAAANGIRIFNINTPDNHRMLHIWCSGMEPRTESVVMRCILSWARVISALSCCNSFFWSRYCLKRSRVNLDPLLLIFLIHPVHLLRNHWYLPRINCSGPVSLYYNYKEWYPMWLQPLWMQSLPPVTKNTLLGLP